MQWLPNNNWFSILDNFKGHSTHPVIDRGQARLDKLTDAKR